MAQISHHTLLIFSVEALTSARWSVFVGQTVYYENVELNRETVCGEGGNSYSKYAT